MINKLIKLLACVLPPQCGKTSVAVNEIDNILKKKENTIHIVYTKNDLINNNQFAKRLENIETIYGKGSVCTFSSNKKDKKALFEHVSNELELRGLCTCRDKVPKVVVVCSNTKRFNDIYNIIKSINDNDIILIKEIYLYYDELHEYIKRPELRCQIEKIHDLQKTKKIIAFTATPENIWSKTDDANDKWSNINIIKLENYNYDNYAGVNSMNHIQIDGLISSLNNKDLISVTRKVIQQNPKILGKDTLTFIPANKKCKSHYEMRKLIFELNENAVVIIINGQEKTLRFKKNNKYETISIVPKNQEINEIIADVIVANNLESFPKVITGHICVSMGQTLIHESYGNFTSAILYQPSLNNDDSYQIFGRVAGRSKNWSTYVTTDVYCESNFMNKCKAMEECAIRLAMDFNGKNATKSDYQEPMNKYGIVKKDKKKEIDTNKYKFYGYLLLKSLFEVKENSDILKYSYRKPQTKDENDCYKTSLTGKAEVQSFKNIESNLGIAVLRKNAETEQFRTYMPYYENKKKETESFILFIRTPEDAKKLSEDIQKKIVIV